MKKCTVDELMKEPKEFCMHITNIDNLDEIKCLQKLEARMGKNSIEGKEKTAKVFFAKGVVGEIGLLNKYFNSIIDKFNDEYEMFEFAREKSKSWAFLKLDLKHTTIEEYEKMIEEEKHKIDYLDDDLNEESGEIMTIRNMHCISKKDVALDKISIVSCNSINLIKTIYRHYCKIGEKKEYLECNEENIKDYITPFVKYCSDMEFASEKVI